MTERSLKIGAEDQLKIAMVLGKDDVGRYYFMTDLNYFIIDNGEVEIRRKPGLYLIPVLKSGEIYWYDSREVLEDPRVRKLISEKDTLPMIPDDFFPGEKLPPTPQKLFYDDYLTEFFHYESFLKGIAPKFESYSYRQNYLETKFPELKPGAILNTKKGNFWFWSVESLGLATFSPNRFQNVFANKKFSTRSIYPLETGKLIVSSHAGIIEFDGESGDSKKISEENIPFRGVTKLKTGELLVGSYGSILYRLNLKTKELKKVYMNKEDYKVFPGKGFLTTFGDKSGNIWVGTGNGLIEYNIDKDSTAVFKKYNQFSDLQKETINCFQENDDGIWGSSSRGIFVMKPEKGIVAYEHPLPDLRIEHFYREDSVFWLATYGKGLVKWNSKTGKTTQFGLKNGLLDEHLMAVYPDKHNKLWVTTNMGLAQFNRTTERFKVFLKSDGITHNEFNISSHFQDENGKLFFGGLDGITAFHPDSFIKDEKVDSQNFVITGYEEISTETLEPEDKTPQFLKQPIIRLTPDIQTFSLKFALLNFENTKQTRYAYKIEGLDNDWTFQKENYVKFSRLPHGEFKLRLKAIDFRGTASKELEIPLEVIEPFYQQLRWQMFAFLFLAGTVYAIFKRRQQISNWEKEKLERIVSERTAELKSLNETKDRIFAILAHDLRNPVVAFEELSGTINYLMQKNAPEQVAKLGNHIEVEAKQLHHLLDNLLNWAMAQREELLISITDFNLSDFVVDMIKNYEHLENRTEVEIINEVSSYLNVAGDRRVLEIVFRNIITNAFRFTSPGGWIKISARSEDKFILINVADNGSGMTPNELKNLFDIKQQSPSKGNTATVSLGMHLCKELIELIGGEIFASAHEGKGTLITLKLTVSQ